MSIFDKGLIIVAAVVVISIALAVPLILRKVPPNIAYGYRTRATLRDPKLWYDANAHFGWGWLIASIVSVVIVVLIVRTASLSPQQFLYASIAALIVPSLVAMIATASYVRGRTGR